MFRHRILFPILILFLIGLGIGSYILVFGFRDNPVRSDIIVVLGTKANPDGTPSPRLIARLEEGRRLLEAGYAPAIMVSGGTGKEKVDESAVMKKYLLSKGIPLEKIYQDHIGNDTEATAINTKKLMDEQRWTSAIVVSQYFHLARTQMAFHQQGISAVTHSHARFFEIRDLFSIPREIVAFVVYALR